MARSNCICIRASRALLSENIRDGQPTDSSYQESKDFRQGERKASGRSQDRQSWAGPSSTQEALLGYRILAELDRRDKAYYYWTILATVFSFIPYMMVFPPFFGHGEYAPYLTGPLKGFEQYTEIALAVATRLFLGFIARFYFWLVTTRDNILSSTYWTTG